MCFAPLPPIKTERSAVHLTQLRQPRGTTNFIRQREKKKSFFDVSHVQLTKMAEVSGLRSRNHFEPDCKSRVIDEGKSLLVLLNTVTTVRQLRV